MHDFLTSLSKSYLIDHSNTSIHASIITRREVCNVFALLVLSMSKIFMNHRFRPFAVRKCMLDYLISFSSTSFFYLIS